MVSAIPCPSAAELNQLVDGQSSEGEIALLEAHLAQCDSCLEVIKQVIVQHETLNDLLSEGSTPNDLMPAEDNNRPIIQALIERLEKMSPVAGGVGAEADEFAHSSREPGSGSSAPGEANVSALAKTRDGAGRANTDRAEELWGFLAPPQAPDEIGRLGAYRVLEVLGHGGMGVVFKAEDTLLLRTIAIKAMLPRMSAVASAKERFLREARAAAALKHDNVISIYQVGEDRGVPFLAMELLKGESLVDRLEREKVLPLAEVIKIGVQIAEGLAAAHEQGLIHRDIKPGNIWLESRGGLHVNPSFPAGQGKQAGTAGADSAGNYRVKILDFGLARSATDQANLTLSGAIVGTPAYMAPEQASDKAVDHRCDLFSLGTVLYRMCTGRMPFKGNSTMAILSSLAVDEPAAPASINPSIPSAFSALIMELLSKDPGRRPQSALKIVERLLPIQVETARPADRRKSSDEVVQGQVFASLPRGESGSGDLPNAVGVEEPNAPFRPPANPVGRSSKSSSGKQLWLLIALGLLLLLGGGLALYRFTLATQDGILVVEVEGDADVRFKKGKLEIHGEDGKLKYTLEPSEKNKTLPPGKYLVKITGADGLRLESPEFTLESGGKATIRVRAEPLAARDPRVMPPADPNKNSPQAPGGPDGFVSLFNGKNLDGWTTYSGQIRGWKVEGGELIGESGCTHLYAWPIIVEDFHLRMTGRISEGGVCQTIVRSAFPPHPPNGYHWKLSGGDGNPQLTGSVQNLGPVTHPWHTPDEWVDLELVARGEHFESRVNGKVVASFRDQRFPSGTIALTLPIPGTTVRFRSIELKQLPPSRPPTTGPLGEFVTIFDGKTAGRWRTYEGGLTSWTLVDGCLVSKGRSRVLYSDATYQNFHLRAEVLVSPEARAAIGMRCPFTPDAEGPQNYSVVLSGQSNTRVRTGSIDGIAIFSQVTHDPNEWAIVEAICQGTRLITRVNGRTVVDIRDRRFHSGRLFLLNLSDGFFKVRKVEIREFSPTFINALGMEFAQVPRGRSWLGGGDGKPGNRAVEFKEDFYLGVYEVTQDEWTAVMGSNPSQFWRTGQGKEAVRDISDADLKRFPVDNVSWNDTQHFLKVLNERTRESGWIYRLPTAEEWEYACRGGPVDLAETAFDYYVDGPASELLPDRANFQHAGALNRTCKVGSYPPNQLGIHDMHGNAWELCDDVIEGKGVVTRLMRGGSWKFVANSCRARNSFGTGAISRNDSHGLRVARVRAPAGLHSGK